VRYGLVWYGKGPNGTTNSEGCMRYEFTLKGVSPLLMPCPHDEDEIRARTCFIARFGKGPYGTSNTETEPMAFDFLRYEFLLRPGMPLLMHWDDVEAADELSLWRKDPKNKSLSVAGDDRSPPWTWMTYVYHDGTRVVMPQENIMAGLRAAGARIAAKGKSTYKALSQSGLLIEDEYCAFTNNGQSIDMAAILAFRDEPFAVHKRMVKELGFDLSIKRARINRSKNVRVRPRFDHWEVRGVIQVFEPAITCEVLEQMFSIMGRYVGLCDWRPSSKESPGPYGTFTSEIRALKGARKAV
jgi:hypothetical protein